MSTEQLYESIKTVLQDQLKNNIRLLYDSSIGEDIVVFWGATGAGKSTLINIFNDKEMVINDDNEIEIGDINDPSYMVIGMGGVSETLIPRTAKVGDFIFYDLPGFFDTRGPAINLVNASYIKRIMENAKSVRLVFVAGQDEITASRGDSFKKLLKQQISQFLKSSLLVVTKCSKNTPEKLIEFLEKKIDNIDDLEIWLNPERTLPMSRSIDVQQKTNLFEKIQNISPSKIEKVNIEAIYSTDVRNDLRHIFQYEMEDSLQRVYNKYSINQHDLEGINESTKYFQNQFEKDVLAEVKNSDIIMLMKPIVEKIYSEEEVKFSKQVNEKIQLVVTQLEAEKIKLEKQIGEKQAKEQKIRDEKIIEQQKLEYQQAAQKEINCPRIRPHKADEKKYEHKNIRNSFQQ